VETSIRRASSLIGTFDAILGRVEDACRQHYGDRLVSLAVFGSVGRGTPRPDSDIDVLLVVDPLPDGRTARMAEFAEIERSLAGTLVDARTRGVNTSLSPVLKTPAELAHGSPLLLDMIDDARLLIDTGSVPARALDTLRARLAALGARHIWRGNAWYWDLKPDLKPGEVFTL
jgi:hypothetical protein